MAIVHDTMFRFQLDKIKVFENELYHLSTILKYLTATSSEMNGNTYTKKNEIDKQYLELRKKIGILKKSLDKKKELIKEIETKKIHIIKFLALFDYINERLNSLTNSMYFISRKTYQLIESNSAQTLPTPRINRRYINSNMSLYIDKWVEKNQNIIIKTFGKEASDVLTVQTAWNYKSQEEYDGKMRGINMSYWYFEIPFLLPVLTHEIAHVAVMDKIVDPKDFFSKDCIKEINNLVASHTSNIGFVLSNKNIQGLLEEVLADLFALAINGPSYIMILFLTLAGTTFSKKFLDQNPHTLDLEKELLIDKWEFNVERDYFYIRIKILLLFYFNNYCNETQNDKVFEFLHEAFQIVNDVYSLDTDYDLIKEDFTEVFNTVYQTCSESSLEKQYSEYYPIFNDGYEDIKNLVNGIALNLFADLQQNKTVLRNLLNIAENKQKYFNAISEASILTEDIFTDDDVFIKLIEKINTYKFENSVYDKDLSIFDFLFNIYLSNLHSYEDYRMGHLFRLFAIAKEQLVFNTKPEFYYLCFVKTSHVNEHTNLYPVDTADFQKYYSFGIYDFCFIIDTAYPVYEVEAKSELYFYSNKQLLVKFYEEKIEKDEQHGAYSALFQSQLEKGLLSINDYVKQIKCFFETKRGFSCELSFFRTLGWSDVVLKVEYARIDDLYTLKEYIFSLDLVEENETTFLLEQNGYDGEFFFPGRKKLVYTDFTISGNYLFVTNIKIKNSHKEIVEKKLIEYKKDKVISKYFITPGRHDIRVYWNNSNFIEIKSKIEKIQDLIISSDMYLVKESDLYDL